MKASRFAIFALICLSISACDDFGKIDLGSSSLLDLMDRSKSETRNDSIDNLAMFKSSASKHYGIDVSHYQGDIVSQLDSKDSLRFVICKATEGQYFVDPYFHKNWREIKEKGLIRGTYHFYTCSVDPKVQANHFFSTVEKVEITDIAPILDIEQGSMTKGVSGEQMVSDILVFLEAVEQKFNRKPILYTDYAFAQQYFTNSKLADYDLWIAEYTSASKPRIPTLWKDKGFFIWQKSSSYHDHSTQLDFDEYNGVLRNIAR